MDVKAFSPIDEVVLLAADMVQLDKVELLAHLPSSLSILLIERIDEGACRRCERCARPGQSIGESYEHKDDRDGVRDGR